MRGHRLFRNPEKLEQGWTQMREDRAAFVAFFGGDGLLRRAARRVTEEVQCAGPRRDSLGRPNQGVSLP